MKLAKTVESYINESQWKDELQSLRAILTNTELSEELKWGTPHYTINGKIVVGIAGFKSYFGLWFHQGVFLKDPYKVLINAQEGTTRGLRQWRFQDGNEIIPSQVKEYVLEAVENQKAGKEIEKQPKKVEFPDELKEALASNSSLSESFEKLTQGRQKEYAEHIGSAKQEKTRISRLEKCIPMIQKGVGLHDHYN
ncbi:MAG: YdeI/OmpD-associated family protein [Cryomorphaceae bacterium]